MGQDLATSVQHGTMLSSKKESKAAILASRYLDVGSCVLGDGLTCSQRFTLAKRIGIIQFPFLVWHMEYL